MYEAHSAPRFATGREVYDREYYARCTGDLPYDHPNCQEFFGRIADEVTRSFRPRRVFDAGCALGYLVQAFWDRGVEAWGRDISQYAHSRIRPDLRTYCSIGSISDPIEGEYDLVTCIEVLEHMPEEQAARAVENMANVTDRVLFSSSPIDFKEATLITVRPPLYWLRLFANCNFSPNVNFDASFLVPHAFVLERTSCVEEQKLLACAEIVRQRLIVAERNRRMTDLEADRAQLQHQLEAERAKHIQKREVERLKAMEEETELLNDISEIESTRLAMAISALGADDRSKLADNVVWTQAHARSTDVVNEIETQRTTGLCERSRNGGISDLQSQLGRVATELEREQNRRQQFEQLYEAISNSTFWRMTYPARSVVSKLPPFLRRKPRLMLR
jgi:SAM-dependent methyltransferase